MPSSIEIYKFKKDPELLASVDSSLRLEKGDTIQIQGIDWKITSIYFAVDNTLSERSMRTLRMIVFCTEIKNDI